MAEIKTVCAVDKETLKSQHEAFIKRRLKSLPSYLRGKSFKKRTAIICAAGPSLADEIEAVRSLEGDIFSAKTEKFLRENGIVPKFDFHVDARESEVKYIDPHKDTVYLISTQCHPSVFDKLEGYTVYGVSSKLSNDWFPPCAITSGANVTSQAIILASEMGYKNIHVFGYDCSTKGDMTHVIGSELRPEKQWFEVGVEGADRKFVTNHEMLSHARESTLVASYVVSKKVKLQVHGTGLVQATLKATFCRGQ